jgi:RNA polymerase sigma factor (sigma-70 family)
MPRARVDRKRGAIMRDSSARIAADGGDTVDLSRHLSAVRRFLMKRAPIGEVDDLVQEVALRMQTRRATDAIDNIEGYLFQVAQSVLTDRGRRDTVRHRSAHDSLEEFHHPVEDRSPERVLQGKEHLAQLIAAMNDLPDRTRLAFVLHRFEEMSYAAIARHMGISVSAVEKHIMKAIKHLAGSLH